MIRIRARKSILFASALAGLAATLACTKHSDPAAEAPPPPNVVLAAEPSLFGVDHSEQFPLATATEFFVFGRDYLCLILAAYAVLIAGWLQELNTGR